MQKLDTTLPEQLAYSNAVLSIEVLGGLKLEGLDRMRVTLKVSLNESSVPPVRHNLDLYNDTQLEKFIRKVAERLEIGTTVIGATLAELTQELETYRMEKIREQNVLQAQPVKPLTDEQKTKAIEYLKAENLIEQTASDLQASGIVGEQTNSLILYIAMTSRKMHDPLSVICLAKSGVGKSYLMEKVAMCIPAEDTKEHTQFSGNSFYYYKREEIRGKVFLIEDLDGAQAVLFPIRELQTKKRISKTVTIKDKNGGLKTVTLIVEGPVSVIGCTTKESVYEDNANRAIMIYLDSSHAQDEKIMSYQKQLRAGLIDTYNEAQIRERLQHMQKALEPVKVINPYAPLIDLPSEVFKKRRTLPMLLSFIEAITFYHQHQRAQHVEKSTGEIFIETHPADIEQGFKLLSDVLFRKSDELSGALRDFYEQLKCITESEKLATFKISDLRKHTRTAPRTLQYYIKELTAYGYVQIAAGKQATGYEYQLSTNPSRYDLQTSIDEQIKTILSNIWKSHDTPKRKRA